MYVTSDICGCRSHTRRIRGSQGCHWWTRSSSLVGASLSTLQDRTNFLLTLQRKSSSLCSSWSWLPSTSLSASSSSTRSSRWWRWNGKWYQNCNSRLQSSELFAVLLHLWIFPSFKPHWPQIKLVHFHSIRIQSSNILFLSFNIAFLRKEKIKTNIRNWWSS